MTKRLQNTTEVTTMTFSILLDNSIIIKYFLLLLILNYFLFIYFFVCARMEKKMTFIYLFNHFVFFKFYIMETWLFFINFCDSTCLSFSLSYRYFIYGYFKVDNFMFLISLIFPTCFFVTFKLSTCSTCLEKLESCEKN